MYNLYHTRNPYMTGYYTISVVGCGGTGGYVAEGIARVLPEATEITLIDYDKVEERNLRRQNFYPEDIGKYKSEALALRLSHKFNRSIAYSTQPIHLVPHGRIFPNIVIGCVDNGIARGEISEWFARNNTRSWWVDAGNDKNYGQIIIGNKERSVFQLSEIDGTCYELPLPTIQCPELLKQQPPAPSCAEMDLQGPTINSLMAPLVVEVVRRILSGNCPWMRLYLDMDTGTLTPVNVTPENVKKLNKGRTIIYDREGKEIKGYFKNNGRK